MQSQIETCKQCVLYAICKAQMQPYMKRDLPKEITLGYMQTIGEKCSIIDKHIKERYSYETRDQSIVTVIYSLMRKVFK